VAIPAHTDDRLLDPLRSYPVTGGDMFDGQIAVTIQENAMGRIYSFNAADFEASENYRS